MNYIPIFIKYLDVKYMSGGLTPNTDSYDGSYLLMLMTIELGYGLGGSTRIHYNHINDYSSDI